MQYFIFHTIGPTDLPSEAHFRPFKVFLIYFPKCPSFGAIKSYSPTVIFYYFIPQI